MQTLPTVPEGFTRTNEYPKFTRTDGATSITDKFFIHFDDFEFEMIEQLEASLYYGDLVVSDISAEPDVAQNMMFVTIKYGSPGSSGLPNATDGQTEWTLDDSGMEVPIDKKKKDGTPYFENYYVRHNYSLAAASAEAAGSSEVDTLWNNKKTIDLSYENSLKYKWLKDADSLPEGWTIVKEKTKGIESVLQPSAVVVGTAKYTGYNSAVANRKPIGKKVTPAKTFGITGEWLVVSSSISKDGRRWVVTTRYQNAPEWDSDYYST